jgi:hypothetical protein
MKQIKNNFLVVSDYNWLPVDIEESWVAKATDNYIILDKYHRPEWKDHPKVKQQLNVGQNVYDMFDFILENYDDLPEGMIFVRSCLFFPKGNKPPISNGNCSEEVFAERCNNTTVSELHDYGPEVHNGHGSRMGPDGSFLEINNSWFFNHVPTKHYRNTKTFLNDMYKNPDHVDYIRFAPGFNYVVPKENVLKYSKKFYERIRDILSWGDVVAEAHMLERTIYTIFTCDWEVKDEYK